MKNRQMKLHGERAPRRVPNGLNVWPAFKSSITQFTSIYLLEWSAFSLSSQRFTACRTRRLFFLTASKVHASTRRHVRADVPSD